jgi:hypothetical protein
MNTEITTPTRKAVESGVLSFDGGLITYLSQHYGSFSVPLAEVAVIGEVTTEDGPGIDDWFLVFVPRSGSKWFEASMYAEGMSSFQERLSAALGSTIIGRLATSTSFASRIVWPESFADRPLFTFSPVTGSGCLRRFKLLLLPEISYRLSPDALAATERST